MTNLNSRYFNKFILDSTNNKLTKTSEYAEILSDEISWYLNLPNELKQYIPKIYDYSLGHKPFITMEKLDYQSLSYYYTSSAEKINWKDVTKQINQLLNLLKKYTRTITKNQLSYMYMHKTKNRLLSFINSNKDANELFINKYITINEEKFLDPLILLEKNWSQIENILFTESGCIMHGDLCFSNILYSPDEQKIKLVDPRGNFGIGTIYGDLRYDYAKLRHSLTGYDLIIDEKFDLRFYEGNLEYEIYYPKMYKDIEGIFFKTFGLNDIKVRLIESLLFLSMIPLHKDYPNRQWTMYALGTSMLTKNLSELAQW